MSRFTLFSSYGSRHEPCIITFVTLEHHDRYDISFSFVQHLLRQLIYHYWSSYTEESFSLVLWTYHGYGLCCGQSWNSHRSSLGQPYFFQSPCGISAYVAVPLPRFLRFRVNRLMRKREFYFFSFSCRQAVVVADEEFTFYADSQPFSCLSRWIGEKLFSQSLQNTRAFLNFLQTRLIE
jgi:hypothetical protein